MPGEISAHFYRSELTVSVQHPALAAQIRPTVRQTFSAVLLAETLLEPIRTYSGRLEVLSWLRSPDLNKAVHGSPSSDHLEGGAADIVPEGRDPHRTEVLFRWALEQGLPYKQLIWYPETDPPFLHVSINLPGRTVRHEPMVWWTYSREYIPFDNYGRLLEAAGIVTHRG